MIKIFKIKLTLTQKIENKNVVVVYQIGITEGLASIREVAALVSPHGSHSKAGMITRLSSWRSSVTDRQSVNRD